MKFTGPGAHTNRSRGVPNPVLAAARCISEIYTVPLPDKAEEVSAVYNVGGMMSAGNVVNAVPQEVAFTVDLRTVDKQLLATLDDAIVSKCDAAARAQKVEFAREWIQKSEAGGAAGAVGRGAAASDCADGGGCAAVFGGEDFGWE
jgi:metal-dependent amidase/aminoacylase/carboxypeptidase family protein